MYLGGKKVLLGVTGGIAAYKAAELCRALIKKKASVRVMMTKAATQFIAPLTFESLSGNPVIVDLFNDSFTATHHIDIADWADLVVIAPATANTIAKINSGLGDDFFSTVMLAVHSPVLLAPAMNTNMWHNPITQRNIESLKNLGYYFCPPESGDLACGYTGDGRLAPLDDIIAYCNYALAGKDLKGKKVLINGGPTVEDIDPVRYLSNRSSGKMAVALANEAFYRGASVTFISGPISIAPVSAIEKISVRSAEEMFQATKQYHPENDIFIASAAVSDFTINTPVKTKIKKEGPGLTELKLKPTADILLELSSNKQNKIHIGFALETDNAENYALSKMKNKKLDVIILNNPKESGAAFEGDTNKITIFAQGDKKIEIPLASKKSIAKSIFDELSFLWKN